MIENREDAQVYFDAALVAYRALDKALGEIAPKVNEAEFRALQTATGKVMGEICLEVFQPFFRLHPDLMPEEWKE